MSVSENIKRLRFTYDLTQQQLADIAGVSNRTVSSWELGNATPRMNAVDKIVRRFRLSRSNILDENGMNSVNNVEPNKNGDTVTIIFNGHTYTKEEMGKIEEYADFIRSLRK